jgi:hypothetical protein
MYPGPVASFVHAVASVGAMKTGGGDGFAPGSTRARKREEDRRRAEATREDTLALSTQERRRRDMCRGHTAGQARRQGVLLIIFVSERENHEAAEYRYLAHAQTPFTLF